MARKGQKQNRIDEELILKIVKEKKKGKSYGYLSKKYNVPYGSVGTWVRKYTYKGYVTRDKVGVKKASSNMTIEELKIEIDILKKFQAFLNQQQERK